MATCVSAVILATATMIVLNLQNRKADAEKLVIEGRQGFRWTL